ncbi:hypothetical protein VDG1235_128 [Verrucomicrobiia bacterium DG1235]|nr:hypothetical protein VDG1235_128 [Verrucomicrobiae bacterium DG1235]
MYSNLKTFLCSSALLVALPVSFLESKSFELSSPDGRLRAEVVVEDELSLSLTFDGETVVTKAELALAIKDGPTLGEGAVVLGEARKRVSERLRPVVRRKSAELENEYEELSLSFDGGYGLEVRAFDSGIGYRFVTSLEGSVEVKDERMSLSFPEGSHSFFPEEETMMSHNERLYPFVDLEDVGSDRFCSLPVLVDVPGVAKVVFTEADLFDYPAMYLKGGDGASLYTQFPMYVLETRPAKNGGDRNVEIVKEADFIAKTSGARNFPWRVFAVSDRDADFVENELVFLLSRPNELEDTSWIEPGRVAWDWYNANNIWGVDFESGINNDTYKYYIDFASKYGIEYVILDEGWSKSTTNLFEPNPEIDVPELVKYGAPKGVKIILWSLWGPMDTDAPALFDLYKSWGVAGVKIDFMQRSDQWMVQYYERIAREAAKRELLVDYHGSFKPAGLRRALPNVISYEGVKGNENNKWSADITPEHNVTIPFIRMLAGPMDYTPGAMANANPRSFAINHFRPMGLGTRAHEVAKYIVYESALQMYCDTPSRYLQERETTEFITRIPSVWDETIAIDGVVGDYIVVARRSGKTWFVAAMTDGDARELEIDLSFLPKGKHKAVLFEDGANSHNIAIDYERSEKTVTSKESLLVKMAPGGGWSAIIEK